MKKLMNASLKRKLLLTHLLVSGLGGICLVIALFGFLYMKVQSDRLVEHHLPITSAAKSLVINLNRSLAALRGWVAVPDKQFLLERQHAWKQGITPSFNLLKRYAKLDDSTALLVELQKLNSELNNLSVWQWRISDVAQTPGNDPIKLMLKKQFRPLSSHIFGYITLLIEHEKAGVLSQNKSSKIIADMADFRGHFTASSSALLNLCLTRTNANLADFETEIAYASRSISNLSQLTDEMTPDQKVLFSSMDSAFKTYQLITQQLITMVTSKQMTLSEQWLAQQAIPISQSIQGQIQHILKTQQKALSQSSNRLKLFSQVSIYLAVILIFLMFILSLVFANTIARHIVRPIRLLMEATQRMAEGRADKVIKTDANDEIGQLTKSFNQMRTQRRFAEKRTNAVIEAAIDPMLVINNKGIIQSCNEATMKVFGYQQEEMVGYNVSMLMPEPHRSSHD